MPDIIADRRITQEEANNLMAPLELDLLSAFKVMQEDILTGLENYEGTPEQYIEEVLKNLSGVGEMGEMAVLKGKSLPVGTRRQRSDGVYIKQPDGTWLKETEKKEKTEVIQNKRDHRIPEDEEYSEQFAINIVNTDLKDKNINNPILAKNIIKSFSDYTGGEYYKLRENYNNIDNTNDKSELTEKARNIEKYLSIAPKFEGVAYRGIAIDSESINNFLESENEIIDMKGFSSWSSDIDMANKFVDERKKEERGILFVINKSSKGSSIAHLSNYPNEKEIMFSGKQKFRIKKIDIIEEEETWTYDEEMEEDVVTYEPKILKIEMEEI